MMAEQEAPGMAPPPGPQLQGQNPSDVTNLESRAGEGLQVPGKALDGYYSQLW